MIEEFKSDILKIYNYMMDNNKIGDMGYPDHDLFQSYLVKLGERYKLTYKTEYRGKIFYENGKRKRGRIDIVYYKDDQPYIALEIDCGLKGHSVYKLVANDDFKYRIWFCYNRKVDTKEYYDLINSIDSKKEIIYLTANRWIKKSEK